MAGFELYLDQLDFLFNGKNVGFISCKFGVRQGDFLSPILFCLAKEVLSRAISKLMDDDLSTPLSGPLGKIFLLHSLYINDILIYCKC